MCTKSYDSSLSIKVINKGLLKNLKDYFKKGTIEGFEVIPHLIGIMHKRMTTAADHKYWSCAYINVCARNPAQVLECVIMLFDLSEDDIVVRSAYMCFKDEFRNNAAKVNANYKYVEWINVQDDSADNGETFWHENGVKSYVVS